MFLCFQQTCFCVVEKTIALHKCVECNCRGNIFEFGITFSLRWADWVSLEDS